MNGSGALLDSAPSLARITVRPVGYRSGFFGQESTAFKFNLNDYTRYLSCTFGKCLRTGI